MSILSSKLQSPVLISILSSKLQSPVLMSILSSKLQSPVLIRIFNCKLEPQGQIWPVRSLSRLRLPPSIRAIATWVCREVVLRGLLEYLYGGKRDVLKNDGYTGSVEQGNVVGDCHGKIWVAIKIKSPEVVLNLFASASSSL